MTDKPIEVGTLVVATKDTAVCKIGERGVCYEIYTLEGRNGYGILFERGKYDGFSESEVQSMLEVTDVTCLSVADYEFTNVIKLSDDYQDNYFREAWDLKEVRTAS